ncbi:40S ribosomal protein S19-1, partial [Bienertia sinuspersici]
IELSPWTDIVKTGVLKELAPIDPDWYYIRATSMARRIYLRGGLGVGAFRRIYVEAREMAVAHPTSKKAVVLLLDTFFNSFRK